MTAFSITDGIEAAGIRESRMRQAGVAPSAPSSVVTPTPALPRVRTHAEAGYMGHLALEAGLIAEHGPAKARRIRNGWRRKGGRRSNAYYDALSLGSTAPATARSRAGSRQ
jgi:hypothetical protein